MAGTNCGIALGVSTGDVKVMQLSATSATAPYRPHMAHLFGQEAWCATSNEQQPIFTVCSISAQICNYMISFERKGWNVKEFILWG